MSQIRRATYNDIPNIIRFLEKNWRNSILSRDRMFFDWMFCNNLVREKIKASCREIDFLIAVDSKCITACLGTLQSKSFCTETDPMLKIVWFTNWVSSRKGDLTGIKLVKYAEKHFEYDVIGTIGCNQIAQNLYKALGYTSGKMGRLVSLNPNLQSHRIVSIGEGNKQFKEIFSFNNIGKPIKIKLLTSIRDIQSSIKRASDQINSTGKPPSYYINRYLFHPVYKYKFYAHHSILSDTSFSIIIIRQCRANTATALRIVDIIGSISSVLNSSKFWLRELFVDGAEYVDLYHSSSINILNMGNSGFLDIDSLKDTVVPGYFEPFLESNPLILSAFKAKTKSGRNYIAYKGDCDQDRPS